MKRIIQTTFFVVAFSTVLIYSKSISRQVTDAYNKSIAFMTNNTLDKTCVLGF